METLAYNNQGIILKEKIPKKKKEPLNLLLKSRIQIWNHEKRTLECMFR
jgi:hypothetical protein